MYARVCVRKGSLFLMDINLRDQCLQKEFYLANKIYFTPKVNE